MVMIAPGSDAFMTVLNKARDVLHFSANFGVAAYSTEDGGFALKLMDATKHDARYLKPLKVVSVSLKEEVAKTVAEFGEAVELDRIPLILNEHQQGGGRWVLVDPAELQPEKTERGVLESSYVVSI